MSFSFGSTTPGAAVPAAFSFGSPSAAPAAAPAFGTSPSNTGFSFGAQTAASTAPSFGGAFSSPAPAQPATSGFSFNSQSPFGVQSPTAQPISLTPQNQNVASPLGFGQVASPPATSAFSFATKPAGPAVPAPTINWGSSGGSLSFGQTPAPNVTAPQIGTLNFGAPSTAAPGYSFSGAAAPSFGQAATSAPTSTLKFGVAAPPTNPAPIGFGQVAQPNTSVAPISFGQPAQSNPTPISFGQSAQPNPAPISFGQPVPAVASAGLSFGLPAVSTVAPGLNFGSSPVSSAGLSFGSPAVSTVAPGLNFGSSPVSSALSFGQPAVSTVAPNRGFPHGGVQQPATTAHIGLNLAAPAQAPPTSAPAPNNFGASSFNPSGGLLPVSSGMAPLTLPATSSTVAVPVATTATVGTGFTGFTMPATSSQAAAIPASISLPSQAPSLPASTAASIQLSQPAPITSSQQPPASVAGLPVATSGLPGAPPASSGALSTLGGFGLPTSSVSTAVAALTTSTTTSAAPPPSALQSITFAQMEESINKWSLELEDSEKVFINQATQINAWDKLLIANGDKIVELNEMLQNARAEQQSLDHEMDFVIGQQRELEELLIPLEKELGNVTTDPDREQTYQLADSVDTQLKQMSEDLKEIIEHINESNRNDDNNDPIVQIGKILNAHMSSMQWIDSSTAQISSKLEQLSAMHNIVRRDNERSFNLTYN